MDACAFLNFLSLMALTMTLALSCGIPWVSVISRRTVSFAAGVTAPSSRFFTGTPRLTSFDCSTSSSAFILKSLSATRVSVALVRSKATQDVGLAVFEGREHFLDRLGEGVLEDLVVGTGVLGVGEIVEQLVVLARCERRIEGEVRLGDGEGLGDLFLGDVHAFGDLLHGRLAAELLEQRRRALPDAVQRPGAVERDAHDARLLGERLENRLADPPHRIRDELDPFRLVELVGGANQAEVALVDQIGERDTLILVLLRDRHHEPQVGAHQLVERLGIALLDPLRERHFLLTGDQRVLADLAEILVERSLIERGTFRRVQLHGRITLPGLHDAAPSRMARRTDGAERGGDPPSPDPQAMAEPSPPRRMSVSQGSASCASRS